MRKSLLLITAIQFALLATSQNISQPRAVQGELFRVIPSLKDFKPDPTYNPPVTRDLTGLIFKKTWKDDETDYGTRASGDPVVQKEAGKNQSQEMNGTTDEPLAGSRILQNYDGMSFTNLSPADPCLDNSSSHIIQMINGSQGAYFRVWDKSGGSVVAQTYLNQLVAVPGYAGFGDPIVMYDRFADRWFISEFGATAPATNYANTLIFAVSQTGNPAGAWNLYKFIDNTVFIDYPHYAIWPDAIYGTSNDFNTAGTAYLGSSIMALDKAKMITGQPLTSLIRIQLNSSQYTKFVSIAPVSISGPTPPPAGSPGMIMYYHDDNRTSSTTDADSVGIIHLQPDFTTPANTTVTFAQQIPVAPFKGNVCASRACIPGGSLYDAISDRFMHRVNYRNFGTHEALVANHTVDANYPATPAKAGLRWYELRRSGGPWSVFQQSTYSPDADGRWMGSININSSGQIGLAYNHSGSGKFASIYFTGRNSTDPPGTMVYDESSILQGAFYGTFGNRWGDYNDLTTDFTNDSIFWFTAMYGGAATTWRTRIASFRFDPLPALDSRIFNIINPASGLAQCSNSVTPQITIRNAGSSTLTSLNVYVQVDNGPISAPYAWNGSLAITQSAIVSLPAFTVTGGPHNLKIFTGEPNGGIDENKLNDTASASFSILVPLPSPIIENFQPRSVTSFSNGWRVENANPGTITWERNMPIGGIIPRTKTDSSYAMIRLYDYTTTGHIDDLLSPILDITSADSVILTFERAYRRFSTTSFNDAFSVLVSTDCGVTFTTAKTWRSLNSPFGCDSCLATVDGAQTTAYIPPATGTTVESNWKQDRVSLKPFAGTSNSILVAFRTNNNYGQNLFLDDINIRIFRLPFRDALVRSVSEPFSRLCTRTLLPNLTIGSKGRDTLKTVKIMYRITGGSVNQLDSIQWSGNLPNGASAVINFASFSKTITLPAAGNYIFTAYTKDPNGLNDEDNANDTLRVGFVALDPQPDPVKEGFEQPIFPPQNWTITPSGSGYTWERNTRAANENTASAWIRNFRFNGNGSRDELYSPLIQIGSPDSVYLHFDLAHSTLQFPGSSRLPLDTLEILLTSDCGKTFRSVYKKWGEDLTTTDKNFPLSYPPGDTVGFVPGTAKQWRTEWVDVSKLLPANSKFQFVFRNINNKGNNTFIDKIDISTITLPARLKQMGYMITPNPFDGGFVVRHLLPPANLRGLQVTNSIGQLVVSRSYGGNASNYILVDLSVYASGAYVVKLIYDNKVITERIIKRK